MFGNPKGELRICSKCGRKHDILRETMCFCACGNPIYSKEYNQEIIKNTKLKQLEEIIEEVKNFIIIEGFGSAERPHRFPVCRPIDAINILEWFVYKIREVKKWEEKLRK